MWYTLPDSNRQYPLTIETVRKIRGLNMKGTKADDLEVADLLQQGKVKVEEPQFVDVVGQISLRTLERNTQKRKQRERQDRQDKQQPGPQGQNKDFPKRDNRENNKDRERPRPNIPPPSRRPPPKK